MPTGFKAGGRQKGTPNKITSTVREAFERAFVLLQEDEGSTDVDGIVRPSAQLGEWAKRNPTEFYKLASKLIPSDINANVQGSLVVLTGVPSDDDVSDLV